MFCLDFHLFPPPRGEGVDNKASTKKTTEKVVNYKHSSNSALFSGWVFSNFSQYF